MDISELKTGERERIAATFLFAGANAGTLERALGEAQCVLWSCRRGKIIFSPESFERGIAVILGGTVLVTKGGGKRLIMSELRAGDVFGAATLFNNYESYTTTLTAQSPVRMVFFGAELVRRLLQSDFAATENYLRYLSGRIRFLSGRIDLLAAGGGRKKLYDWLCENADESGAVKLATSLSALSETLSIGRASLYRALDELRDAGVIHREGKTIQLL